LPGIQRVVGVIQEKEQECLCADNFSYSLDPFEELQKEGIDILEKTKGE